MQASAILMQYPITDAWYLKTYSILVLHPVPSCPSTWPANFHYARSRSCQWNAMSNRVLATLKWNWTLPLLKLDVTEEGVMDLMIPGAALARKGSWYCSPLLSRIENLDYDRRRHLLSAFTDNYIDHCTRSWEPPHSLSFNASSSFLYIRIDGISFSLVSLQSLSIQNSLRWGKLFVWLRGLWGPYIEDRGAKLWKWFTWRKIRYLLYKC